jgi:hypothetical protein
VDAGDRHLPASGATAGGPCYADHRGPNST